jgi:hypothetical protein
VVFQTASLAVAELARGDARQGLLGAACEVVPSPQRLDGHGLTLHGIHARQPPDRSLVEFDRLGRLVRGLRIGTERHQQLFEACTEMLEVFGVHPEIILIVTAFLSQIHRKKQVHSGFPLFKYIS